MPAPTRARRARPTRPLACHACNGAENELTVERGQNSRRRDGTKRTAVNVVCKWCGHEWFSVHPDAIQRAKAADAEARG